jgi:hypothetical protein
MKNRLLPIILGASILGTIAFWNTDASAQSNTTGGRADLKPPLNRNCIVTLDARSNSRSTMTSEMRQLSGFVRQDTAQGTLIHLDAAWLVLKDGDAETWIPRDKVLMLRASR